MQRPSSEQIIAFLSRRHGGAATDLEPLTGGYWSSAYAYRVNGRELVLRLGEIREGFEADRAAMAYGGPDLPVPEVIEVGDAFGGSYAISVRHHGRFLEDVSPDEAETFGRTIVDLLAALKAVPQAAAVGWKTWLVHTVRDDPDEIVSGWRVRLAADPDLDALYRACERRIADTDVPERRDLVHGDLLHQNVLVSDDASRVTAVFSWKCSTRGDFLYDTAWCTFWAPWHPGIEAADVYHRVLADDRFADGLDGAAQRHHLYEVHIGARHLGWNAWTGDEAELRATAERTAAILERGPR